MVGGYAGGVQPPASDLRERAVRKGGRVEGREPGGEVVASEGLGVDTGLAC